MTLTSRPTQPQAPHARMWALTLLLAAAVGVVVAVVYANYNDPWRPLAHSLGLWAVMATAVAFRRPLALAIGASIASLAAAVITFYIGLRSATTSAGPAPAAPRRSTGTRCNCGWCWPSWPVSPSG